MSGVSCERCTDDVPVLLLPGRITGAVPVVEDTPEAWIIRRTPEAPELRQATRESLVREWNLYQINGPGKGIPVAPYFY